MNLWKLIDLRLIGVAALIAGGVGTTSLAADGDLITGTDYDAMIEALEKGGFKVALTEDDDGDPLIELIDDDEPFTIHFYRCNDSHECDAIQFVSGWNLDDGISMAKMEQWNQDKVWGQAYRNDSDDPWIAYTINLYGGVSVENFEDSVEGWHNIMRDFEKHIGWDN